MLVHILEKHPGYFYVVVQNSNNRFMQPMIYWLKPLVQLNQLFAERSENKTHSANGQYGDFQS